MATLSHIHRFVAGDANKPLLLLHGTGGDENDLVQLGEAVAPGAALLSPRGQVKEGGANRFFRRFAEGVFDVADLKLRTDALADFVKDGRAAYQLGRPVALGFSNGANIAAALLLRHPGMLAGAILLRAMTPFEDAATGLDGTPVLLLSGLQDPMMPVDKAKRLADQLREAGAAVEHQFLPGGHGLTQADLVAAQAFLQRIKR